MKTFYFLLALLTVPLVLLPMNSLIEPVVIEKPVLKDNPESLKKIEELQKANLELASHIENLEKINLENEDLIQRLRIQAVYLKKKAILNGLAVGNCSEEKIVEIEKEVIKENYIEKTPEVKHTFFGLVGYGVRGGVIKSNETKAWSEPVKGIVYGAGYLFTPRNSKWSYGGYFTGAETFGLCFSRSFGD